MLKERYHVLHKGHKYEFSHRRVIRVAYDHGIYPGLSTEKTGHIEGSRGETLGLGFQVFLELALFFLDRNTSQGPISIVRRKEISPKNPLELKMISHKESTILINLLPVTGSTGQPREYPPHPNKGLSIAR